MKKIEAFIFCLLFGILTFLIPAGAAEKKQELKVYSLPLQEGQVCLIQTPSGKNILYDTGGLGETKQLLAYLQNQQVTKLDLVVLSHPHCANIGGIQAIMNRFPIGQIIDSGIYYQSELTRGYLQMAQAKGIPVMTAEDGLLLPIDVDLDLAFLRPQAAADLDGLALGVKLVIKEMVLSFTPENTILTHGTVSKTLSRGSVCKTDGLVYQMTTVSTTADIPDQGKFILIDRKNHRLSLYHQGVRVKQYPIAVGKASTPTPVGNFYVVNKVKKPWKAAFGVRWLGFHPTDWPAYGIHGTNEPNSIGHAVSHGCVRMQNRDALELYYAVELGTPIKILK